MTGERMTAIPAAPPCPSWCEGHPHAEHGRWDAISPHATGVEVINWCRRGVVVAGVQIDTARSADWIENEDQPGAVKVDPAVVALDGERELTPDQAEEVAAALITAARLARQT